MPRTADTPALNLNTSTTTPPPTPDEVVTHRKPLPALAENALAAER